MKIAILDNLMINEEKEKDLMKPFIKKGIKFFKVTNKRELRDANAVITTNLPITKEDLMIMDNCRFIDVAFTGVDHIDMTTCKEKGIVVSNASGYATEAVSELAILMILSLLRNIKEEESLVRNGEVRNNNYGYELKGKTVGIVGVGSIGKRTAEILHSFGSKIIGCGQYLHDDYPDYIEAKKMGELLELSDIVILHCPLNESTKYMITKEELFLMKKSALLINVARGPVVKMDDLVEALKQGDIGGAGIDVYDNEPPIDDNHPIFKLKNVICTGHIGFATKEAMEKRAEIVFENLEAFINGNPIRVVE